MVDPQINQTSGVDPTRAAIEAQRAALEGRILRQVEISEDFEMWSEQGFDIVAMRKFRTIDEISKHRENVKTEKEEKPEEKHQKVQENEKVRDSAARFQQQNQELKSKTLLILLQRLSDGDTPETILTKVLEVYSDYSLADEALDFLLETTSGTLKEKVQLAKDALNQFYGREVRAGRNISTQAKEFSEKGLGSATALRDMYRDVTGNQREVHTLFDELFSKYTYSKMKTTIDFLLHSLGADLKAKGPSISRAELQNLVSDARMLQAILGVYRFFDSRMALIIKQFLGSDISIPTKVNFELLAYQFMQLVKERYISPDRVLSLAKHLGISEKVLAQIIIFTQMRDAIRQVAPRLYRNPKHKHEVLYAIVEALEELEDLLEEEE